MIVVLALLLVARISSAVDCNQTYVDECEQARNDCEEVEKTGR